MSRPPQEPDAHAVFELLVRDHADHLIVFLRAVVYDRSLVDDVFQETMMVAWRRLGDFDKTRSFGAWIRGIGSRVAMDMAGKRRMAVVDPVVLQEIEQHSACFDGDHADSFQIRMQAVEECLHRLPDMYSEVIRLVYRTDSSMRDVATTLKSNEESIKKRLQRARAMLGECLQRKGVLA